jgi:signal transduction histidine kinase
MILDAVTSSCECFVRSLVDTLARTPCGARIDFDVQVAEDLTVPMDRTDLAEVLGNSLDNAVRHARSRVRITTRPEVGGPSITIEDDGRGIVPSARADVIERGARLDEREGGAGLGLAIVQDVLEAYDWQLDISASECLGGLKITISPGPKVPGWTETDRAQT